MLEPATTSWDVNISAADFTKLKAGIEPRNMDDKWRIWTSDKSHNNNIFVHYTRSWTGNKVYILNVKPNDGGSETGAKIIGITWTQNLGGISISETQGKKDAVIITRAVIRCDIEALPEYDFKDLHKHSFPVDEQKKRDAEAYAEKLRMSW